MNKVGIDVLEVKRMEDYVKRELPMEKIFTEYEIEYIKKVAKSYTRMAGIFSAKEAFLKATGVGVKNGISLLEVEVKHEKNGRPYLNLIGKAKDTFDKMKFKNCDISISHTDNIATAICILN